MLGPDLLATLSQTVESTEEELPADPMVLGAVIAVGAVVAILVTTWALWSKAKRQRELPAVAAHHGLRYSDVDPFDSTRVAFDLFRAGDGRKVEHVMWDEDRGTRVFDYAYYVERRDNNGRVTRTWTTFSCALARHDGSWPEVRILRERLFDRALARIGMPDIDLESEEFNRAFVVQCADRRFATTLLDPRMMDALLAAPSKANVETKGRWVLVWSRRLAPAELPALLATAQQFCERIPPVVRDLYGELPAGDPLREHGLGLPQISRERHRDPAWDRRTLNGHSVAPGATPWVGTWGAEQLDAQRRSLAAQEGRDLTPAVEYDIDGNPVPPHAEDPWGDGPPSR